MVNYGAQTLVFELPAPPARVWGALTEASALTQWFGDTNFRAQTGLPFTLRPHAGGAVPAGAGEVVAVEPPRRLVMRWRTGGRVLGLTILVEPAVGGSLLRVAYSDTQGVEDAQSAALRHLYDQRLRAFLAGAPLLDAQPASVAKPAPPVAAVPTRAAVDEERPKRRRGLVPIAAGAGVVILLLLVGWTVAGASFTSAAPGASPTSPARASTTDSVVSPSTTASAGPTATAFGSPGPLAVASQVTNRQANSVTVIVTITNSTNTGLTWRNVSVMLNSSSLTLSNVDGRVNYDWSGTRACFKPGPAVTTVPAKGTVTFPFTVNGSAPGDVTATILNNVDCN